MKIIKLIWCALCAAVFAVLCLVGCEDVADYPIASPSDLQERIDSIANIAIRKQEIADSIAAALAAKMEARLMDDVYQVGNTDNSSGWWGGHSKYYRLADNDDSVYVKFKNFTSGKNVWANWVQAITSDAPRGGAGYVEYALWRADNFKNFAWGTENGVGWNTEIAGDTHGTHQTTNYSTLATDNTNFTEYTDLMNGADCIALIRRGGDSIYVDVKMTAKSGRKLTKSWYIVENDIEDKPIRVFWTIENCHLVFYKTLTDPLDEFTPNFELDPNWNSEGGEEPKGFTYRADLTATITSTSNDVYTYSFFAEGLPYGGYGTFLVADNSHMVIDPNETYYSALADSEDNLQWYFPYAAETNVGLPDNSSPWWTAFSNYTTVVEEAYFHYKFVNHSGANNWNNWVLVLTNGHRRGSASYREGFVLRSDLFGWGLYYDAKNISHTFPFIEGTTDVDWDAFRALMNGATVEIEVTVSSENSSSGRVGRTGRVDKVSGALSPGRTIE
jgi:hypothetical protein